MADTAHRPTSRPPAVAQHFAGGGGTPDLWRRFAAAVRARDRWTAYALGPHLQPWGEPALEFQARADARVHALLVQERRGDPVRREVARAAMRLLRQGVRGRQLLARLDAYNATLPDPLEDSVVDGIALWAARRHAGGRHDA